MRLKISYLVLVFMYYGAVYGAPNIIMSNAKIYLNHSSLNSKYKNWNISKYQCHVIDSNYIKLQLVKPFFKKENTTLFQFNNLSFSKKTTPENDFFVCANQGTEPNQDYDCDGIINAIDLDDDNDGITDEAECGCSPSETFTNGSFEMPDLSPSDPKFLNENGVPGWSTTSPDNAIEFFLDGFNAFNFIIDTEFGDQYAEINANNNSTLFQTFCLNGNPGTLNWSVYHRGRQGFDRAVVKIANTLDEITNSSNDTQTIQKPLETNDTRWERYEGDFVIEPGTTSLVIAFQSVSTFSGDNSVGNFIDNVQLTFNIPCTDTDGDGIENKFDLDSDGDGCPDAIEGNGNFESSDLVLDSGLNGGNSGSSFTGNSSTSVQDNLGAMVSGTNGIPTSAGNGQSIGESQTPAAVITITTPPQDQNLNCTNSNTAQFSATATSNPTNATLNYQWLVSTDNGISFSSTIIGAQGNTSGTSSSGIASILNLTGINSSFSENIYKIIYTTPGNSCLQEAEAKLTFSETPPELEFTISQPTCDSSGSIIFTTPNTSDYEYSIDNGLNYQMGTLFFNFSPGEYNLIARKIANQSCSTDPVKQTINPAPSMPSTPVLSVSQPACDTPTGTITVTSPTGAEFEYSSDGTNFQTSNTFSGLSQNTYTISVRRATDTTCVSQAVEQIINPPPSRPSTPVLSVSQPACDTPTGTITVTSPTGAEFEYSSDGTNFQTSNTFSGLSQNTYTISVRRATDTTCVSQAVEQIINPPPSMPSTPVLSVSQPTCDTPTGTITVTSPTGAEFEYSSDGTNFQTSNIFSALSQNTYTISVRRATDTTCVSQALEQIINPPPSRPSTPVLSVSQPACDTPTGTITVTSPTGAEFEYSSDGTNFQTSNIFSGLSQNTYTISVRRATDTTCVSQAVEQIINPAPSRPSTPVLSVSQPACDTPTGTITVTSPTGAEFEYSSDGTNFQTSNTFSGLSQNTYTISVRRATDTTCVSQALEQIINPPPSMPSTPVLSVSQPACDTPTGTITVTSPTGAEFEYSSDGTNFQTSNTFSGLSQNTYTISVRRATDTTCVSQALEQIINPPPSMPSTPVLSVSQPACDTPTGTITVTSPTGAEFEYSSDGTNFQTSNTFSGLSQNTYTISVRRATDTTCISQALEQIINPPPSMPSTPVLSVSQPTCDTPTGTITVTSPTGAEFEYSSDGTNFQTSNIFSALSQNTYTISVRRATDTTCVSQALEQIINPPPSMPSTPVLSVSQPACDTPTGTITVTSPTGAEFEYSSDGTNFQTSNTFSGLSQNTYTISVRRATDTTCVSQAVEQIINPPPSMPSTPVLSVSQPACDTPTGTITVTSPTGTEFEYSSDGTNFQTSNIFSGLSPNTYTISVRRATDTTCVSQAVEQIINPAPSAPSTPVLSVSQPTCDTPTGTITVTSPTGAEFEYSSDGTNFQTSNTFSGFSQNTYTISVRRATDTTCVSQALEQIINPAPSMPSTPVLSVSQPSCDTPTGTITVTSPTGAEFEYSSDGTNFQTSNTFSGLSQNTYTISVRRATDTTCVSQAVEQIINPPPSMPSTPVLSVSQPACDTPTGTITVTSPTGTEFEYSSNGTNFQTSNIFSGLSQNTYTISVRRATDTTCVSQALKQIINPQPTSPESAILNIIQPTCNNPTGTITVETPLGRTIEYSIDGGLNWQSNTTFSNLSENTYTIETRNTNNLDCPSSTSNTEIINLNQTEERLSETRSFCVTDPSFDLNSFFENTFISTETSTWQIVNLIRPTDNIVNPSNFQVGNYTFLSETQLNNCTLTRTVFVTINNDCIDFPCIANDRDIEISSLVTPNNDGKNDYFSVNFNLNPINPNPCSILTNLKIYNRWGALVYQNEQYENDWNGQTANIAVGNQTISPRATYYYIVELTNSGRAPIQGFFLLGHNE